MGNPTEFPAADLCMTTGALQLIDSSMQSLTICANGGAAALILRPDGRLEAGPGLKLDDAATREIFDVMAKCLPCWMAELKSRADVAEATIVEMKAAPHRGCICSHCNPDN